MEIYHNNFLFNKNYIYYDRFNSIQNEKDFLKELLFSDIYNINNNIISSLRFYIENHDTFFNKNYNSFLYTYQYLEKNYLNIDKNLLIQIIEKDLLINYKEISNILNLKLNFFILKQNLHKKYKNIEYYQWILIILILKLQLKNPNFDIEIINCNIINKLFLKKKNYKFIYDYYFQNSKNVFEYKNKQEFKNTLLIDDNIILYYYQFIENSKEIKNLYNLNYIQTNLNELKNLNLKIYTYKTKYYKIINNNFVIYDSIYLKEKQKNNIPFFIEKNEILYSILPFDKEQINNKVIINKNLLYIPLFYQENFEYLYNNYYFYLFREEINKININNYIFSIKNFLLKK